MADAETNPDVDVDADELDSAAIAAAMGFSSFGSQPHPNKRRRFNPLADAVIDTPRDSRPPAARPGPPRPPTTAANSVPVRPVRAPISLPPPSTLPPRPPSSLPLHLPLPTANTDEIDLDDDDNDDDGPGPRYIDTSRPIGKVRDHGLGGEVAAAAGGQAQGEDDAAFQARMQAVVAAGNARYGVTEAGSDADADADAAPGPDAQQLDGSVLSTAHLGHHHHHHPEGGRLKDRHGFRADLMPGVAAAARPGAVQAVGMDSGTGADGEVEASADKLESRPPQLGTDADSNAGAGGQQQQQQQQQQQGGHDQGQRDWWTGYYDPSSNENPWSLLEAKLELPPRSGSWLEHGHHSGQHGNSGGNRGGHRGRGGFPGRARGQRRY